MQQSCELITSVTAIACAISKCYTNEELAVIASVFTQLGDTMLTLVAQNELCEKNTNN